MLVFMRNRKFGKVFAAFYVVFWLIVVACSWIYWAEMHIALKALIVVLEIFFIPDVQAIKGAFRDKKN